LLRKGGDCGIVIPSGIYTDLGAKQLREMLFDQTRVTGLFGFENRKMVFEGVDSRFKFVVLTFRKGGQTTHFPAAFMRLDVQELEHFPAADNLAIKTELVRRLSPDSLSIMEFKSELDVGIAERMLKFPLLGETISGRWNVKLAREFDMTQKSAIELVETVPVPKLLPLFEGKMIWQFDHSYGQPKYWVDEKKLRRYLYGTVRDDNQILEYQKYRLVFRRLAASTNERTLVSTVIPPAFHADNLASVILQPTQNYHLQVLFLGAFFNSLVLDYNVRQRVTTNLNFFYIYQLPVPRLTQGDRFFAAIVERAARLICTTPEFDDLAKEVGLTPVGAFGERPFSEPQMGVRQTPVQYGVTEPFARARLRAELDGMIAHLYELTEVEFAHILNSFPLVPEPAKVAAQNAYRDVERGLIQ